MSTSEAEKLIKATAGEVRRWDFLWIAGMITGLFLGLAVWGEMPFAAIGLAWALLIVGLAVRYRFSSARTWAAPIEKLVASEFRAREAEKALLGRVRSILAALPEPLFLVNQEGRIEATNPAAEALVGFAPENKYMSSVLRAPAVLAAIEDIKAGAPAHAVDYDPPGAVEQSWQAFVTPLGGEEAERKILVILHDLTAERRVERMRVDFIANASHELRTPLASMAGFIETLRGHAKEDPSAQERFLEIMEAQAARMGRLIDDLMSLSRIELNEHMPPDGVVDLGVATADMVDGLRPIANQAGIALSTDIASDAPLHIEGERDEIIQVVQNLVDNAIKYSADGKSVHVLVGAGAPPAFDPATDDLEVETHRYADAVYQVAAGGEAAEAGFVYIQVRDEGRGIARGDLPRLTERFYRVDVETSRARGGTGLGLAIVKHIVNRHRGGIAVESAPGHGSAFTVVLRAAGADDEIAPIAAQ